MQQRDAEKPRCPRCFWVRLQPWQAVPKREAKQLVEEEKPAEMGPAGAELSGKVKTLFIQLDLPSSIQAGLARSRSLLLLRLGLSPAAPLPKQEFTQALLHVSLQQSGGNQQSICSTSRPSFPLGCLLTACAGSQEQAGSSPSPSLGSRRAVSSPGAASCPFHSPHSFFLGCRSPGSRVSGLPSLPGLCGCTDQLFLFPYHLQLREKPLCSC